MFTVVVLNAGLARAALPVIKPSTANAPYFNAPQYAWETPDVANTYESPNGIYCTNGPQTNTRVGTWSGVASGYLAQQLTVRWYATSAFALRDATGDVTMKIEYSLNNGSSFDYLLEQFTSSGPDGNHNFGTWSHTAQATLPEGQDASAVQVRATLVVRILTCPGPWNNSLTGALYMGDISIQTGPPLLDGPSTITRGDTGTFTVKGAPGATMSNWYFAPTAPFGNVNRATGNGNATWTGTLVADGSARVHVVYAGTTYDLSKSMTVNPRSNWATTPPRSSTELSGDHLDCADGAQYPPNPPSSYDDRFGGSCPHYQWSVTAPPIQDNGPNQGYRYATGLSLTDDFAYIISPPLQDPASQFYLCQTGVPPIISAADLIHGNRRHEGGLINSHFIEWANAWTAPDNNFGTVAETIVSGNVADAVFLSSYVNPKMTVVAGNLYNAYLPEPCAVNRDDTCTTIVGAISFIVNGVCTIQ
jgi:hypothetical protein